MSVRTESSSIMEMEDMSSATQLIDERHAYENNILSSSLPSILGSSLRAAYLKRTTDDAALVDQMQCEKHPDIESLHYCRDCDKRVCSPCITIDHIDHDVTSRDSAIDEKFDNLAGSIAQFSEMLKSLDSIIEKSMHLRANVLEEKQRAAEIIESKFEALHRQLDLLKMDALKNIDQTSQKYISQCDERIDGWTSRRTDLTPLENLEDDVKSQLMDGQHDLFDLEQSVRSQLIEAKALLPSLLSPKAMRLSIQWNEKFLNALEEKSFGSQAVTIIDEEYAFEPFKKIVEFSTRHVNDKVASCIDAFTFVKNSQDGSLQLALVDSGNSKIKVFTQQGRPVRCFVGGGRYHLNHPSDIESLDNGTLLVVSDPGGNKVVVFSERGVGVDHFGVGSCDGLAFVPIVDNPQPVKNCEEIYVLNSEANRLEHLDIFCRERDAIRIRKQQLDIPLQHMGLMTKGRYVVANSINGCLFVCDPYEHCLLLFSPDGAFMKKYGRFGIGLGELNTPAALACDRKGQVLVADFFNHRIHLLDQCGNFIRFILTAADGIYYPRALKLDPDNAYLWVAQRDGIVKQFSYS